MSAGVGRLRASLRFVVGLKGRGNSLSRELPIAHPARLMHIILRIIFSACVLGACTIVFMRVLYNACIAELMCVCIVSCESTKRVCKMVT